MSNLFSLDALREEVDKDHSPVKIALSDGTEVVLRSLLRLSEKAREEVMVAVKSVDSEDAEVSDVSSRVTKVVELIAGKDAKKLIKELDGDVALIVKVIETWIGASQLGEAPNSPAL